jgi:hypothetical protein
MVQGVTSQVNFTKEKKDLISNIQIRDIGAKVYTLLKMQVTVLDIRIIMETMLEECFLL